MKKLIYTYLVISFFFVTPGLSQSDSIDVFDLISANRVGLFDSDEILKMTLRFDIRQFTRGKSKNEYHDAFMTYYVSDTDSVTRKIKLRSRGEFRRNFCDFPPIRLNLKKNELPDDIFGGVDKIKMVTHCKVRNREYILKEYLIYKLFNVISDISFRVRLLKINYIDTLRPARSVFEYAFLIEPVEFLAKRTNSFEIKSNKLNQLNMKPDLMNKVAIFNYMIGNYDWSVPTRHNIKLLSKPFSEQPHLGIPVPYDFDYSGLVNATYAIPPETSPIKSVRERLFLGACRTEEEFINILDYLLKKKNELYNVIEEFPYLEERSKKYMINYLDTFYNDFDKSNSIVLKLLRECLD